MKTKQTKKPAMTKKESWSHFVNTTFAAVFRQSDNAGKLKIVDHIISLLEEEGGANSLEVGGMLKGLRGRIQTALDAEIAADAGKGEV